jgi:hypothetical protein
MKFQNLILILTVIAFVSCSKETIQTPIKNEINGFLKYSFNKSELIVNEEDEEDEIINVQLIEIAQNLQTALTQENVRKIIIELAKEEDGEFVTIQRVLEEFPNLKSELEITNFNGSDYFFIHKGITHEPVINIPNIEIADFTKAPLISPGIEVEDDEEIGIDDFVFSWLLVGDKYEGVVLGEEQALSMTNPLFAICPKSVNNPIQNLQNLDRLPQINTDEPVAELRAATQYHSNEFQINHRYENSGKSEFWVSAAAITYNGTPTSGSGTNVLRDGNSLVSTKEIAQVHKNDIGTPLSHWEQITADHTPRTEYHLYFNTYERDWIQPDENIGYGDSWSKHVYLYGRMKYASE